jgi:type III restriction enzyme
MALHPSFPKSPYEILNPAVRWFPADEALREKKYAELLPPLVAKIRQEVFDWRLRNYEGASATSKALLRWWFETEHVQTNAEGQQYRFQYYFCQREAVETIVYLYDVKKVKDKYDLLRYDSSEAVSPGMIEESWRRYVIKMATGSGKTKVLSLILAWAYFHKLYEADSGLARNFLLITPNIIVLDRIRTDFDGLKIFYQDPVLPDNGYEGQNWHDDFQLTLHIQDEVNVSSKYGNIFLTNIHRIYDAKDKTPSLDDEDLTDYFLGKKAVAKTNESQVDLGKIVRDIDELVILNDEAHHIHDPRMAWFKSIQDIHNKLLLKGGELSLQVDVTATPKRDNGAIFVQTVSDYPLVEAIYQNVVKHPILPDEQSRAKLVEIQSSDFTEKYREYIHLGYLEWKKVFEEHKKCGKKAVLFVMTDDTRNCDDVSAYLERMYPELKDAVLTIHTKDNGEIAETAKGKDKEELKRLRDDSNHIDGWDSRYKAIVSVLMLKEGWDVKNVTTIVGLRAYNSKANILPEQTLGRGLRRMYRGSDAEEYVSIIGTQAFMDFVESIKREGVDLDYRPMGEGTKPKSPIVVEIDTENVKKDREKLDIELPIMTPRIQREYKNLSGVDVSQIPGGLPVKQFNEYQQREIIFCTILDGKIVDKVMLDNNDLPDFSALVGFFTQQIMRELRLVSGFDVLFGKVKEYISGRLFATAPDFSSLNTYRNFSEPEVRNTIVEGFKKAVNDLTVLDKGDAEIKNYIKISKCRPFVVKDQGFLMPKKSLFNKIVGDSHFELEFASFLDSCDDVISYAKNYFGIGFRIDYKNHEGNISDYYPDFLVKINEGELWIVETKGVDDLDAVQKEKRLEQWCRDINALQPKVKCHALKVYSEDFQKYNPASFEQLIGLCSKRV